MRIKMRRSPKPPVLSQSFPNAEAAEDAIEQVVGVNGPYHLSELIESEPQLQGQQLGGIVEEHDVMSGASALALFRHDGGIGSG